MKFKTGDNVKIFSKSIGRDYNNIIHTQGIISHTFITNKFRKGGTKIYVIKHDHFLECDLIDEKFFTDKDFEL